MMYTLGISFFNPGSAAALLKDGELVAACQEERFSRQEHDSSFPSSAIRFCLRDAGIKLADVQSVVLSHKPLLEFERVLETYMAFAPKGWWAYSKAIPIWIKERLFLRSILKKKLMLVDGAAGKNLPQLLFTEHHESQAASAFFPSPFEQAAVLCLDGVGEWATTSAWQGTGNRLAPLWEMRFPHSLGLLYSALASYCGFDVNSGEYTLMRLAPRGEPRYVDDILEHLIDLKDDGTFRLDMKYFGFATGLAMTTRSFNDLFGGPPRRSGEAVTQREMDLAHSMQWVTEEIVLRLAQTIHRETQLDCLCLAGSVATNCLANGRLVREGPFKRIWIQPAAGHAGGAVGAAYSAWHSFHGQPRVCGSEGQDGMKGGFLGPAFSEDIVEPELSAIGAVCERLADRELFEKVAEYLDEGAVIGWFQGRMEFGPHGLGARSIMGDPRRPEMQSLMKLKMEDDEPIRPFALSVLEEDVSEYFQLSSLSPYTWVAAPLQEQGSAPLAPETGRGGLATLTVAPSRVHAMVDAGCCAQVHTVNEKANPRYHSLLKAFKERTACSVLVSTSFKTHGAPIVCRVSEAYECFMRTKMDYLVIENYLLAKSDQPKSSMSVS